MFERLRKYEDQAVWAVALAVISLFPAACAAWLAFRNYDKQIGRIIYGSDGSFLLGFGVCVIASMAIAFFGFALGLNSAGQSRNHRSAASWAGFFLGGLIFSADIILMLAFYMLRLRLEGSS